MTPVLAVRELTIRFPNGAGVQDIDLDVAAGETVGLVGGSGAGKSTVARAVAGLVAPDRIDSGRIELDGADVLRARPRAARRLRHAVHLVFQDPYASLAPTLRVDAAVAEPLVIRRTCPDPRERAARVDAALDAVQLEPRHRRAHPHQLSGGQRQRVALARALVTRPRLLLADEPTQMLDASLRVEMVDLLDELAAGSGAAVVHITHDLALAARTCARLVVLRAGHVVESGPTDTLLARPAHPYTADLLAAARRLHTRRSP
ncbi:ABC transporter ATP-binding protein [Pseudonocardia sp.]|uniref:ABC transporter ATP-binding protein n=1 Tax=Pseudonocardia sp. TaxID=60912 RepID=UPI003D0F38F5